MQEMVWISAVLLPLLAVGCYRLGRRDASCGRPSPAEEKPAPMPQEPAAQAAYAAMLRRLDALERNIERYDGTARDQEEVAR